MKELTVILPSRDDIHFGNDLYSVGSLHRKRFVYIISLNQPKYTVDDQGSARPWPPGWGQDANTPLTAHIGSKP